MFKYCVWYMFNNKFNTIIKRNAQVFGTEIYPAHLTIKSGICLDEARLIANQYKLIKPNFKVYGPPVQTHTRVVQGLHLLDFYAIEQPLKINGFETKIHISLAYSGVPFSEMDVAIANMDIPSYIDPEDLTVQIADCRLNPNKWNIIDY